MGLKTQRQAQVTGYLPLRKHPIQKHFKFQSDFAPEWFSGYFIFWKNCASKQKPKHVLTTEIKIMVNKKMDIPPLQSQCPLKYALVDTKHFRHQVTRLILKHVTSLLKTCLKYLHSRTFLTPLSVQKKRMPNCFTFQTNQH